MSKMHIAEYWAGGVGRALLWMIGPALLISTMAGGPILAFAQSPPPEGEQAQEEAPPKKLTPEEIQELPILKRYDIPWEKGEALLGDVKDNTFGYDEAAFYWLVSLVNKLPPERLKPDEEDVAYPQLLSTPSSYRGKPVTIRGVYMTVTPWRVPVVALSKDIPRLFTCTIREHPLEQKRPVATVVVIEDPMMYLRAFDEVRVKGYFYKVRKYEGTKGVGFAPMLVARRLEPDTAGPRPGMTFSGQRGTEILLGLMFGLLIVMVAVFFVVRRLGRHQSDAKRGRLPHRIHLRRPDRAEPFEDGGPGGETGGPNSESRPD